MVQGSGTTVSQPAFICAAVAFLWDSHEAAEHSRPLWTLLPRTLHKTHRYGESQLARCQVTSGNGRRSSSLSVLFGRVALDSRLLCLATLPLRILRPDLGAASLIANLTSQSLGVCLCLPDMNKTLIRRSLFFQKQLSVERFLPTELPFLHADRPQAAAIYLLYSCYCASVHQVLRHHTRR